MSHHPPKSRPGPITPVAFPYPNIIPPRIIATPKKCAVCIHALFSFPKRSFPDLPINQET